MSFTPSAYQQAIFDFVETAPGSAMIEAVAGSGKTTTIVEAVKRMPRDARILFLAFNSSIAKELKERLPCHCQAKTFHSIGLQAWCGYLGKRTNPSGFVDGGKMRMIYRRSGLPYHLMGSVTKLVGYGKNAGFWCDGSSVDDGDWEGLIRHFGMDIAERDVSLCIKGASKMLLDSIECSDKIIDYDDMLYMPLLRCAPFPRHDFVVVDEAQDTNAIQRSLLRGMLAEGGRLLAVGDSCQAIYGFRGADADAMDNMARDFQCQRLPLTVSYRCPRAVVAKAREVVPHIEAHPDAPEGVAETLGDYSGETFGNRDAILCRNTAPLISFAYGLIGRGVACQVLGREIGKGLVRLIEQLEAKGIDRLEEKLREWRTREVAKAQANDDDARMEVINDTADCILAFTGQLGANHRTIPALIERINSLFSDDGSREILTLCTVHKSKGLEWPTVYILDPSLMPSKMARQPWQRVQERNLMYVAYTRAKQTLRFICSGCWKGN